MCRRPVHQFANEHPNYIGEIGFGPAPHVREHLDKTDLMILLGCRFSEVPSQGFTELGIPKPKVKLVHIHPGPEELGRIYAPDLSINATPGAFLDSVAGIKTWVEPPTATHDAYLRFSEPTPTESALVDNNVLMSVLRKHLPADTIMTNGAGNYAIWLQRFWRHRQMDTYLGPTSGSMGFGLPAAIAAKARHPGRKVVCFAGDGCFQMSSQEFGTAVQQGLEILVLVFDNGSYGTIRAHQQSRYPGRVSGTAIANPDFGALARAYGAFGELVETTDAFEPALKRALSAGGPALLHIKNEVEAILPGKRLSDL